MKILQDSLKPIYLQIAEGIEDDILNGLLAVDDQAYSQYQIAKQYKINPATIAKGIALLVTEGILYKKRGLGMHVSENAMKIIQNKRRQIFFSSLLYEFINEAQKLGISKEELKTMIDSFKGGE